MQLQGKLRIQHIKQKIEEKRWFPSGVYRRRAGICSGSYTRSNINQKTATSIAITKNPSTVVFYICKLDILYFCLFLYNIINDKKRSCMQYDGWRKESATYLWNKWTKSLFVLIKLQKSVWSESKQIWILKAVRVFLYIACLRKMLSHIRGIFFFLKSSFYRFYSSSIFFLVTWHASCTTEKPLIICKLVNMWGRRDRTFTEFTV